MTKVKASVLLIFSIVLISTTALALQELVFQTGVLRKQVSVKASPDSETGTLILPKIRQSGAQYTLMDQDLANVTVSGPITGGGRFGLNYAPIGFDKAASFAWTGNHSWSGSFRPPSGGSLPEECTPPALFIDTSADSGKRLYVCEATDTWVLQGDGIASLGEGSLSNSYVPFIADNEMTGSSNLTFVDGDPGVLSILGNLAVGASVSQHAATIKGVLSIASGGLPSSSPDTTQGYGLFLGTDSLSGGESRILTYSPSTSTYLSFWTNGSGASAVERARFSATGQFTLMPLDVSNTHDVRFRELASNGTNYVSLKSPDSLAGNVSLTFPSALPTDASTGFLKSSTGGVLSFVQPSFSDLSGALSVEQGGYGGPPTGADQISVSASESVVNWTELVDCSTGLTYSTTTHAFGCDTGGFVTSVDVSVPGWLSVSGNPITSSGTITVSATPQPPNVVLAGPVSGPSATPVFRALEAGDMPTDISAENISNGDVSNTEFDYLDGVTSPLQTQINNLTGGGGDLAAWITSEQEVSGFVNAKLGINVANGPSPSPTPAAILEVVNKDTTDTNSTTPVTRIVGKSQGLSVTRSTFTSRCATHNDGSASTSFTCATIPFIPVANNDNNGTVFECRILGQRTDSGMTSTTIYGVKVWMVKGDGTLVSSTPYNLLKEADNLGALTDTPTFSAALSSNNFVLSIQTGTDNTYHKFYSICDRMAVE